MDKLMAFLHKIFRPITKVPYWPWVLLNIFIGTVLIYDIWFR